MKADDSTFGREFAYDMTLGSAERLYARLVGVPILGLRIRARAVLPLLRKVVPGEATPVRICDCGCGRGVFSFYIARWAPSTRVVGYDTDPGVVDRNNAIAARAGIRNVSFEVRDITQLDSIGVWDVVLATDCLEHVVDDAAQLRVFANILRPGGCLLLHVPHITRNLFGWRRQNFLGIEGHVRAGYTMEGLRALVTAPGLEVVSSSYSYGWFETLANDVSYLITRGRERNRMLYALMLPGLIALSQAGRPFRRPLRDGSGIVLLARKP